MVLMQLGAKIFEVASLALVFESFAFFFYICFCINELTFLSIRLVKIMVMRQIENFSDSLRLLKSLLYCLVFRSFRYSTDMKGKKLNVNGPGC